MKKWVTPISLIAFLVIINITLNAQNPANLVITKTGDKYGYNDSSGNAVITAKYQKAENFTEGLARVKLNDKRGLIDSKGKVIVPLIYDDVYSFNFGLAGVHKDNRFGFINKNGEVVIPLKYADGSIFMGGFAMIYMDKDSNAALMDSTGKILTPFKYGGMDYQDLQKNGICRVSGNDHKLGYLTKEGKEIIPLIYDEEDYKFKDGRSLVTLNGRDFYIDVTGKEIDVHTFSIEELEKMTVSENLYNKLAKERGFTYDSNTNDWKYNKDGIRNSIVRDKNRQAISYYQYSEPNLFKGIQNKLIEKGYKELVGTKYSVTYSKDKYTVQVILINGDEIRSIIVSVDK